MKKSLVIMAALASVAFSAMSTAYAASAVKTPAIDTGQALAFNVEVPATKQTFAKASEDGRSSSVSVAQVTLRELHLEHVTKT